MKPERGDKVVLISGDRDYLPTVKSLSKRGVPTLVVFWKHAMSHDLRDEAADHFELDGIFELISR
jgi:uncharacterized LabA/DUF88 family protein